MKPHIYFCDLYGGHVYFFIGHKRKDYSKYLMKNWNIHDVPNAGQCGMTWWADEKGLRVFIWVNHKNNHATIAHECLHAANRILGRAEVRADWYNDEPQTYLMSRLIRECTGQS